MVDGTAARARGVAGVFRGRTLTVWLALVLALATVSVTAAVVPVASHGATAGAASTCASDGSSGCLVTLPCATGPCPSVDVSPVSDLADGQYVFVKATNFDPTGSMRVAICALSSSSTDPTCLTGEWEQLSLGPIHVPITSSPSTGNLSTVSYPVFYNPAIDGNSAFPAHDIVNTTGPVPGFFCDNSANPCALVVTEEAGQGNNIVGNGGNGPLVSAANSAVVPLSFAAASTGCPASAPTVLTDSTFSLEHFLPAAIKATCNGAGGVVALDSPADSKRVVSDVIGGGVSIGFIDNPSDPAQLNALLADPAVRGKFAFIPVAVSGAAVSFLASANGAGVDFPVASYNMTPNMLAGIITGEYQEPRGTVVFNSPPSIEGNDLLVPPLSCASLVGCAKGAGANALNTHLPFNAFELLNPSGAGIGGPNQFGSYMSNVANGASFQATSWICYQKNVPFNVSVNQVGVPNPVTQSVLDPHLASTTLVSPPVGSSLWPPPTNPTAVWPFPSNCTGLSTIPGVGAQTSSDQSFGLSQLPSGQARSIRSWAYSDPAAFVPGPGALPRVAFGVMDTSEASYYGLNTVNVQNASGSFVAPTAASLEAAATDMTPCGTNDLTCPANTYSVSYANTDAAAYPMPVVTYAVVPTTPQPAATATALTNLMTNLVTFSHTGSLPFGYAPLPTGMYQSALSEINSTITAQPAAAPAGSGGSTTTSTGSSSTGTDNGSSSSGATGSGLYANALPLSGNVGTGSAGTAGGGSGAGAGGTGGASTGGSGSLPGGLLVVSLDAAARFLLPALVILALACLIGGPLLLFGPGARRRREQGAPHD